MFSETEGKIAQLEDRLELALRALEFCADSALNQDQTARDAIAKIWPEPPKPRLIEVGGNYVCKNGTSWMCIFLENGFAYMKRWEHKGSVAYVWEIVGEAVSLGSGYDIDWSRC